MQSLPSHPRVRRFIQLVRGMLAAVLLAGLAPLAAAQASKQLAPGFVGLPADGKLVLAPLDVELFSMSAGGVLEPRADWTAAAEQHMKDSVSAMISGLGITTVELDETSADEFAEQLHLHSAVAGSIALHHGVAGVWGLPTKNGQLDWSFGEVLQPLRERTGARYALFTFVRDSYASAERKATMVVMAILGVGVTGGTQVGYASLVDLESGRVLWFNQMGRGTGDLRDAASAQESMGALMKGFPPALTTVSVSAARAP